MHEAVKNNKRLFDIFVAKQEYGGRRDRHGRCLYEFSGNKDVLKPVVSSYLVNKGFLNVRWPEDHKFAACLTHDVDQVYPTWKYTAFTTAKFALKLRPKEGLRRLQGKVKKERSSNPCWNFKKILKLEMRYGAKSTFYFNTASRDLVWTYDIEDLTDELRYIADMGWEVGLHGGYYSYDDLEELKKERERLEKALGKRVIGIRMHYLRFKVPDTWRLLADLGLKYDTTFGFDDVPGFRNGMCHPFKPYDLEMEKEVNILEIPLIVMDVSLFEMRINEAWETIKGLIKVTERNMGVITILWHNRTFDGIFWGQWTKLYEKILHILEKKKAWMASGEEIYKYWSKMQASA